jgi:hypothetical protein
MFRLLESHPQDVSHNYTFYLQITSIRSSNSTCHIAHHFHCCFFYTVTFVYLMLKLE